MATDFVYFRREEDGKIFVAMDANHWQLFRAEDGEEVRSKSFDGERRVTHDGQILAPYPTNSGDMTLAEGLNAWHVKETECPYGIYPVRNEGCLIDVRSKEKAYFDIDAGCWKPGNNA